MKLKINRDWKKTDYTIGNFFVNGVWFCNTLEDKDRGLAQNWTDAAIKVAKVFGETAIPTGTYKVILSVSPKFKNREWAKPWGGRTPELIGVKGFSNIRIHCGSTVDDSLGCVLIGRNTVKGKLTNSKKSYNELMKLLVPAYEKGETITLTIK